MSFMNVEKREHLGKADFAVKVENARKQAHFHLCSGTAAGFRGVKGWERGRINTRPMIIYDLSGLPLFYDFPVRRGRIFEGFIRIVANKVLGDPVMCTQVTSLGWDLLKARKELQKKIVKKYRGFRLRRLKLVCYSYPKIALAANLVGSGRKQQTFMIDVSDFTEIPLVPEKEIKGSGLVPYSLLDNITEKQEKTGADTWEKINQGMEDVFNKEKKLDLAGLYKLSPEKRLDVIQKVFDKMEIFTFYTEKTIDFCCHSGTCHDHECFCLHPQENSVHCTRASSQMVFCYWRYCYSQHDFAQAFGVDDDDLTPWSGVASGLNSLTYDCFTASLNYSPDWADCTTEISNRRPFLSDNGGHTRACAGYKQWNIWISGTPQPRYLYIYDPWPVNVGAISWENYNTAYYAWIGTLVRKTTNHT
ncbi:MAG: hypothetical protein C4B58_16175 [Deltaproteobacteria bacterium]|nr:MAG: hypothetical protein C4B58_16175 [Deltaproteobacteria bacterium]